MLIEAYRLLIFDIFKFPGSCSYCCDRHLHGVGGGFPFLAVFFPGMASARCSVKKVFYGDRQSWNQWRWEIKGTREENLEGLASRDGGIL